MVPFLVGFVLFMVVPLVYAIYTSLYTNRIIGGTVFTGASNYTQTLQSGQFWSGVVRVIIFAAIQIPLMLLIAFFFACVFDLGVAKFGRTFRTIFFIPFAIPAVVGAVMWTFLLEPQFGPMVHLANVFGFSGTNFFSPSLILPSIIVIVIWEWTGYNMVILYTALKSVPRDVVEAAILDDTPLWKIIVRIKLPMVRPAIVMLIFLNTIGALQLFIALPLMVPGVMTVLLISIVSVWNGYFLPLLIFNQNAKYPLTVGLGLWSLRAQNSGNAQLFPMLVIGGLVTIIPLIALFLLLQRYWRGGMLLGSIAN